MGSFAASDGILSRMFGENARRAARQAEAEAVDFTGALIERLNLGVDQHSKGETVMGLTRNSVREFEAQARRIEDDLGLVATVIPQDQLVQAGMKGPFTAALTIPKGFALNPAKYASGLAHAAEAKGTRIYTRSPVDRIESGAGGFILSAGAATVTADQIIVATNGYSSDDLPDWLRARYLPAQSNVLVTRPLSPSEISAQGWHSRQMAYDERFFLHYFRLMPDNRFLFGMRGGLLSSPGADARIRTQIRRHFEQMFPAWAHVETPYSWSGLLSLSRDLTPYAGPIPGLSGAWTALNYQGNGVAMAGFAGASLADQISGTRTVALPDIMRRPPPRFPLGRYRRAWLWPAYWAARLSGG